MGCMLRQLACVILLLVTGVVLASSQATTTAEVGDGNGMPSGGSSNMKDLTDLLASTIPDPGFRLKPKKTIEDVARGHLERLGVRMPSQDFSDVLKKAALRPSFNNQPRRPFVILSMMDQDAATSTAPLFLASLRAITIANTELLDYGAAAKAQKTLSAATVMVAWDRNANEHCWEKLHMDFRCLCVWDTEHVILRGGNHFHTSAFKSMGFAKIKYILNAISLGYDTFFLDADILVIQNPMPYMYGLDMDIGALADRCEVVDDMLDLQDTSVRHKAAANIGALFLRSNAPVTRCVYSWFWGMWGRRDAPGLWDQEEFGKTLVQCAPYVGLRWRTFDPRKFASLCYPKCGCRFEDADKAMLARVTGKGETFREGYEYLNAERECGAESWKGWLLAHFPCQGSMQAKVDSMRNLSLSLADGRPRIVKNVLKVP